jgi:hypothetical protein
MITANSPHHPTLEHWISREPFTSTQRTFATVELAVDYPCGDRHYLAARGWVFDVFAPIRRLSLRIGQGEPGATVHLLTRRDVADAFPTINYSLRSGFSSFLPYPVTDPPLSLEFCYQCGPGESVVFNLTLDTVSLGIVAPGSPAIRPQLAPALLQPSIVVVADVSEPAALKSLDGILLEASHFGHPVTIFSDDNETLKSQMGSQFPRHPISAAAPCLLRFHQNIEHLIFIGPSNDNWIRDILVPVIAIPGIPTITWIALSFSGPFGPPLHGGTVDIISAADPLLRRRTRALFAK